VLITPHIILANWGENGEVRGEGFLWGIMNQLATLIINFKYESVLLRILLIKKATDFVNCLSYSVFEIIAVFRL
jgi:hypothetical protein